MPPLLHSAGDAIAAPASFPLPQRTVLPIPRYLEQVYWWAYVHPKAVHLFERDWLVNAILFGNYGRLRDAALAELGETVPGRTLQVACVYGNLTPRLRDRLTAVAPGLAGRALSWAVHRMAVHTTYRHAALVAVKNAAYAWRQGIFFLSFCDTETQWATINWLRPQLTGTRVGPALDGLAAVVTGDRFGADGTVHSGRRWLGWATGSHWALD